VRNLKQAIYRTPNAKVAGWTPARATTPQMVESRFASGLLPGPPRHKSSNLGTRQDSCPGRHHHKSSKLINMALAMYRLRQYYSCHFVAFTNK
jgi:hypothetical protein